jgi:uncharacterized protein YjbI with pentapeptide repeats
MKKLKRKEPGSASVLLTVIAILSCAGASASGTANRDGITIKEGPWLLEEDFDADSTLHAREGQTVLLRLEQGAKRGRGSSGPPGQNTSRLLVEETGTFEFCLPADEPHLTRLKLREGRLDQVGRGKGQGRGRTVLQVRPGDECGNATLAPGSYVLDAFHDERSVPPGKVAFLRLPDSTKLDGDPLTASTSTLSLLAWKHKGKFVRAPSAKGNLVATATTVDEYAVFNINGATSSFTMTDGAGEKLKNQANPSPVLCPKPLFTGPNRKDPNDSNCDSKIVDFYFRVPKATSFILTGKDTAWSEDGLYGYDSDFQINNNSLEIDAREDPAGAGTVFDVGFRGFTCTGGICDASKLKLQKGEVALFSADSYQGTAFVFSADVPDFSIYDAAASKGLAIGDNGAASVRVGPDTLAILYNDAQFGGSSLSTAEDIPSLAALGVSSLKSVEPRQYVLDSNGCVDCDLTGIDLSGLSLAGADFTGAVLAGANLSGTSLFGATLDDANISMAMIDGADFLDTSLRCTDLSDNDLTTASFAVANDPIAAVTDQGLTAVFGVDPNLGSRVILSGFGIGEGVALEGLWGVSRYAQGLLVTDSNRVLQVLDGNRTLISSVDRGTGPRFFEATGLTVDADGSIIVADFVRGALFRVDPNTGDRVVITSAGLGIGSGPPLNGPAIPAIAGDGTIYVTNAPGFNVVAVDPVTGDRTVVSDANTGTGPAFQGPGGLFIDADGSLLVTDSQIPAVFRVDPGNGNRTLISGMGKGTGPDLEAPAGVALDSEGSLLVVDGFLPGVVRIEPGTGNRAIASGPAVGSGVLFNFPLDIVLTDTASLSGRIATDFSCRLNLARSTLNFSTFAVGLWRYLDLRGATINGAAGATLSTLDAPVDLSGAILNGVDLSGSILDGANLGCATGSPNANSSCVTGEDASELCSCLESTNLTSASLVQANLESAIMWGVKLGRANLDRAAMSGAQLLAQSDGFTGAADISGAFMRNVQLDGANLTGVTANHVNFYTVSDFTSSDAKASAVGATMTNAKFNDAYLAGADFGGKATLQSTSWNRAILVGANFEGAHLQVNPVVGTRSDFSGAFMQGAVFDGADVTSALFTNTYWDSDPFDAKLLNVRMQNANLQFAGYWNDPAAPECVAGAYPSGNFSSPEPPPTDSSNFCPDGNVPGPGGCTFEETPKTPIEQAIPATTVCLDTDPPPESCVLPVPCTSTDARWTNPFLE